MENFDDIIVVCVKIHEAHVDDSKVTECFKCKTPLWCSPHNMIHKAVCLECIPKNEDHTYGVKPLDIQRAVKAIKEMEDEKDREAPEGNA